MNFFRDAFGEKTRGGELVPLDGCFRIQVKHGKTGRGLCALEWKERTGGIFKRQNPQDLVTNECWQ